MKIKISNHPLYPQLGKVPGVVLDATVTSHWGNVDVPVAYCATHESWTCKVRKDTVSVSRGGTTWETIWTCTCGGYWNQSTQFMKYSSICSHIRTARKHYKDTCRWNGDLDPSVRPDEGDKCPECSGPVVWHKLTLDIHHFRVVEETDEDRAVKEHLHQEHEGTAFGNGGNFRRYQTSSPDFWENYNHFYQWWVNDCFGFVTQKKRGRVWHVSLTMGPSGRVSDEDYKYTEKNSFPTMEEALSWINTHTAPKTEGE